jgi:hypothetical protein
MLPAKALAMAGKSCAPSPIKVQVT